MVRPDTFNEVRQHLAGLSRRGARGSFLGTLGGGRRAARRAGAHAHVALDRALGAHAHGSRLAHVRRSRRRVREARLARSWRGPRRARVHAGVGLRRARSRARLSPTAKAGTSSRRSGVARGDAHAAAGPAARPVQEARRNGDYSTASSTTARGGAGGPGASRCPTSVRTSSPTWRPRHRSTGAFRSRRLTTSTTSTRSRTA